ncbi:MAG TPA: PP2C family serine/threonine-protein phosphatase [Pyrinomonadaceae bacterium]|nr:PP2C family serine/threonine-protein phosphatase [Pyrinomonadaceae bacterium]
MAEPKSPAEWRVMGETVPGASHLRAGIPNQDSILQVRESGRGLPVVVSVSDGHGSDKCFRSDRGSGFAVQEAARLVGEFLDESRGRADHTELESRAKDYLPREFVRRWREAVEADIKARPFTGAELEAVEKRDGLRALKLVASNPLLAYGATSLTVAVEESFILYLQLGDGEILNVSATGEVGRALPEDERLFANETTSLCTPDAEGNFRVRLQPLAGEPPALILLSTDGYVNSFSDSAGFFKVGSDLLEMLRADGFDPVNASLKGWLEEATRSGSGDDCTLGLICRMDALSRTDGGPKAESPETIAAQVAAAATTNVEGAASSAGTPPSAHQPADASTPTQEAAVTAQPSERTTDPGDKGA